MQLQGKVIVITGAASGIGKALVKRFAQEQPAALVITDLPATQAALEAHAQALNAAGIPALACAADVGEEPQVQALVGAAQARFGRIDVFCSNAGLIRDGDEHTPDAHWQLNWQVHVMAHVYAARAVVPRGAPPAVRNSPRHRASCVRPAGGSVRRAASPVR